MHLHQSLRIGMAPGVTFNQPGETVNAGAEPEELVAQCAAVPIRQLGHIGMIAVEMAF